VPEFHIEILLLRAPPNSDRNMLPAFHPRNGSLQFLGLGNGCFYEVASRPLKPIFAPLGAVGGESVPTPFRPTPRTRSDSVDWGFLTMHHAAEHESHGPQPL
jgi:hypothetical protein